MTARRAAVALVAAVALTLAGCGDDRDAVGTSPDGPSTTAAAVTTTTPPTTEDLEGISELTLLAHDLLLTPAELAIPTFQDTGYTPREGADECGVDVDADHPPEVLVGTALGDGLRTFQQEIRVYADADAARSAFDAHAAATACGRETEPVDVNDRVGADAATALDVVGATVEGLLVTALVSDAVVSYEFSGPAGADSSDLPDPIDVAAFGVGKILAALES